MEQARQNVVPVPGFFFILKVAQVALSVLVLALSAASIALEGGYGFYGGQGYAIFVCIATWISAGWYIASSRFMPNLYHRIPAMVLEVFLWIWWLSCWTTLAYWASWSAIFDGGYYDTYYNVHAGALTGVLGVAAAVAAINWVLVFVTAVLFLIHLLRFQRQGRPAVITQPTPKYEMQPQQQPQYQQAVPAQQQYQAQPQYQQQQQYVQPQAQFDQSGEHKIAV